MVFRLLLVTLGGITLFANSAWGEGLSGRVLDTDGKPLEGVLVIASGDFHGWAEEDTDADGAFRISEAGAFVSARLRGYAPALVAVVEGTESIEIRLKPGDESV